MIGAPLAEVARRLQRSRVEVRGVVSDSRRLRGRLHHSCDNAPMTSNQGQIEYWNGPVGERWVQHQEDMDRAIGAFGDAALARLSVGPGARVLDVGCGAGTCTLDVIERIAPGGALVGVDVSRPLLDRARERLPGRAAELGVSLELVLADAASYRAARPFDALFSRFGVMFFDHPARAFHNLREALASGAQVAFVCWQALADNPWCAIPLAAARRVVPAPAQSPDPRAPGPFAFAERDYVHGILTQAGFLEVALVPFEAPVLLSTSGLTSAVEQALRLGPTGRVVADQPPEVVASVRNELTKALAPRLEGDTLQLLGRAWLVTARTR
jgi:SAM-dependent methyltransferase